MSRINQYKLRSLGLYTLGFSIVIGFILLTLISRHASFIWLVDGLEQQYPFFMAEGAWLKQCLFSGNVQLWNPAIGYGYDNLIYLGNTIGNPINLISIFATPETGSFLLNATVPIMLYIAGITFIYSNDYCLPGNRRTWISALVYVFSGYTIVMYFQTEFLYVLVLAPLLLVGVEKVFQGQYIAYPIVLAMFAIYYVMQVYIAILFTIVYCILRLTTISKFNIREFIKYIVIFSGLTILGLCMAAFFILPLIQLLIHMDRLSLARENPHVYSFTYYKDLLSHFISGDFVGPDAFMGVGCAGFVSLIYLFVDSRDNKTAKLLKRLTLICIAILLVPFFGRITNALSYPGNRWTWVLALISGFACTLYLNDERKSTNSTVVAIGYIVAILTVSLIPNQINIDANTAACFVTILVFCAGSVFLLKNRNIASVVLIWAVCFSSISMLNTFAPYEAPSLRGAHKTALDDNPMSIAKTLNVAPDEGVDSSGFYHIRNLHDLLGMRDSSFYNSYYNSRVDKYHSMLGLNSSPFNHSYIAFNGRQIMESLAGAKYFIAPSDGYGIVPMLFDYVATTDFNGQAYNLYENNAPINTAFLPTGVMGEEQFSKLTLAERQQVLSEYLIRPNSHQIYPISDLGVREVPFEFGNTDGVRVGQETFVVDKNDATVTLNFSKTNEKELYLEFQGIYYTNAQGKSSDAGIYARNENNESTFNIIGKSSHLYGGKTDVVLNVGNHEGGTTSIIVRFSNPGTYHFEDMRISAIDSEVTKTNLSKLASPRLTDQKWSTNAFEFNFESNGETVALRIPYSDGWSATIDNQPAEIHEANIAFMSIDVPQGQHHIKLEYRTPWLNIGMCISVTSIGGLLIWYVSSRRKPQNK